MVDRNCRLSAGACGEYCKPCVAHGGCRGCAYQLGLTQRGECAVFQCCVAEKGLEHCGLCSEFPCPLFKASTSAADAERRMRALLDRTEKGTDAWLAEEEGRSHD